MPFVRSLFTPRRAVGAGVAAVLIAGSVAALASTAAPTPALPGLPSVIPAWAKAATVLRATPADQTVLLTLALKGQDPVGEHAYGVAASTPGNPLYRHWLTQQEFEQQFGPAVGSASAVVTALKALGVSTVMTDKLGLSVFAALPASLASTIFGVTFSQVMHAGQSTRVADGEPTIPAVLRPLISSVSGLTQERVHTTHTAAVPETAVPQASTPGGSEPPAYYIPATDGGTAIASSYFGSTVATDKPSAQVLSGETTNASTPAAGIVAKKPYITSGYTPPQLRGAYGVTQVPQYTGKGVTAGVALFYDGPDVPGDLARFSKDFNLSTPQYTDLSADNGLTDLLAGNAPVLDPLDAEEEQTLDVEAIHQMAPDAAIKYSGALAPEDPAIYVALDTLIASGVDVINNSYGGVGDTDSSDAMQFQTLVTDPAMTMGVGLDFSSGDGADEVAAEGQREVDFPSSSDAVTAVGGTGLEVGSSNNYEGEFYWGTYTSPAYKAGDSTWGPFASQPGGAGGGGGVSTAYAEPSYQNGVVPAEEAINADTASSYNTANGNDPTFSVPGAPGRVTPDVSMLADSTTGILVEETMQPDADATGNTSPATDFVKTRIGGTSVSSPLFTGMMALVDQALGKSAGFINRTIYPFQARNNGAFRDPHIGRSASGSRSGSTLAQILSNPLPSATDNSDDPTTLLLGSSTSTYAGAGSGVVPVISEVRADFTDAANNGTYTVTPNDPTGVGFPLGGTAAKGNPVVYHLRAQGVLGTLEDLPGYDDSTGLGSPDAPEFIADFLGVPVSSLTSPTPASSSPAPSASPTPISTPVKPKPTTSTSCTTVRGSAIKVYGPKTAKLNKHGQAAYSFKLFVNLGKCKTPSAVGRQFFVYVDGHKTATLRTGKNGVQNYLVRLKPGKHTITAAFVGNKDLKKSSSAKFTARIA